MLEQNSCYNQPIFTLLVSLERFWIVECLRRSFNPQSRLWPTPDQKEILKILKIGKYGTLSIRNFILIMALIRTICFEIVSGCVYGLEVLDQDLNTKKHLFKYILSFCCSNLTIDDSFERSQRDDSFFEVFGTSILATKNLKSG